MARNQAVQAKHRNISAKQKNAQEMKDQLETMLEGKYRDAEELRQKNRTTIEGIHSCQNNARSAKKELEAANREKRDHLVQTMEDVFKRKGEEEEYRMNQLQS